MNNSTQSTSILQDYTSYDLEMVSLVQSACSFVATIIILIKVLDIKGCFRGVRDRRKAHKKLKEAKELEKMKSLIEQIQSGGVVDITELIQSSGDEDESKADDGYKIARKKKKENSVV
jgi:hypothetical protein